MTAVTADEMRAVDDAAVDDFGISLLQMMEHAGRTLAWHVRDCKPESVTVLAGAGGNGGGGLCAARHLANRDVAVSVVLDRPPADLAGAARTQYETLAAMGVPVKYGVAPVADRNPGLLVDALVGYGLDGPLHGTAGNLVEQTTGLDATVVSLDIPSGVDATTGNCPGPVIHPDRVVTLALPKTGLTSIDAECFLADIGLPEALYESLDIPYATPFGEAYWVALSA
nr:NAD(P)H-hydrate epimerase [Halomicrobium katesii]